jgi:surface antigen
VLERARPFIGLRPRLADRGEDAVTRSSRFLAALFAALLLASLTMPTAFAATRAGTPTPEPDPSRQLSTLQQQLRQQQATINSLADREESEQASVEALASRVAGDRQQEAALNQQLDRVARIEYERPALTLVTVLNARNLGQLLSGMAQARVIAEQQQHLLASATALKASDERDQTAAQAQLEEISKQQAQATAIAANTLVEISTLQTQQQAAQQQAAQQPATQQKPAQQKPAQQQAAAPSQPAVSRQPAAPSVTAAASITLRPGPSNPNRFSPGYCTWYVAQIYSIPWLGNANQWPAAAAADGQAEGQTPVVGAIMESADSAFGHVSVVISVTDNNDWTVTEMNYAGGLGVTDTRHVSRATSNLVTFIY